MKLRVGNGCWHTRHVLDAAVTLEAGFYAQEGLDVEVVHAKINPGGIDSTRPDGERYDEVRIIGGWRNQFTGTLVAAPGIESIAALRGKRVGDWYKGGIATLWYEHQMRKVGIDPDREIDWKI